MNLRPTVSGLGITDFKTQQPVNKKDPPGWWMPVPADQSMVTEGGTHLTLAVVMERGAPPPYSTQVPRLAERRRYWRSAPSFSSKEAGVPSTRAMRSLDIPPQTHSCHQPAGARLGRRVRSNWLGGGVVNGQRSNRQPAYSTTG
ncbi:hypothetical protein CMEL01_11818 [Colletotrichum melonis]|uniref:Uncharacterized protein n=1 Tax=Colletotrichum melonis TaxID=1209925 RepID=A0AAI9V197_9PEZI|nr:hypothetical protein CMEL01_11818 [Colletotrichum melonis]